MRQLDEKFETDDTFSDEHVLDPSHDLILLITDFANYLASDIVPPDFSCHQKKFMHNVKMFFCDEPYLYQTWAD